jgi:hypothetical protein
MTPLVGPIENKEPCSVAIPAPKDGYLNFLLGAQVAGHEPRTHSVADSVLEERLESY